MRDPAKGRPLSLPAGMVTDDPAEVVADPGVRLVVITHRAPERRQRRAIEALSRLDAVRTVAAAMRVESSEA